MLIIFPSDPATTSAAETLRQENIPHQVITIPVTLGYKTDADTAVYIPEDYPNKTDVMTMLSAKSHVIMRVFKTFSLETTP